MHDLIHKPDAVFENSAFLFRGFVPCKGSHVLEGDEKFGPAVCQRRDQG
jgi:hypothetical protein